MKGRGYSRRSNWSNKSNTIAAMFSGGVTRLGRPRDVAISLGVLVGSGIVRDVTRVKATRSSLD
jgi:hypothetical protein